jgi:hypothetical protein
VTGKKRSGDILLSNTKVPIFRTNYTGGGIGGKKSVLV